MRGYFQFFIFFDLKKETQPEKKGPFPRTHVSKFGRRTSQRSPFRPKTGPKRGPILLDEVEEAQDQLAILQ